MTTDTRPSLRITVGERTVTVYTAEQAATIRSLQALQTLAPDRDTDCSPLMLALFCAANIGVTVFSVVGGL